MVYFNSIKQINKKRELIKERKNRSVILSKNNVGKKFTRGDILTINFWSKICNYHFEGICLSLKNKNILSPNSTIILRNVLYGTGVELSVSYFLNRLYRNLKMSDYKRKKFIYRSSKLYYLRLKNNTRSRVKS